MSNIGTATKATSGNSNITVTVPASGVTAGHSIIVGFASSTFAGPVSCSDSKGNTYSVDADRINFATGRVTICSAHNVTALTSLDLITAHYPLFSGPSSMTANDVSGLLPSGTLDKTSSGTGNTTAPNSGFTATTTAADELLYGAILFSGTNAATFTPGAGYTRTNPDLPGRRLASEYRNVSATGTYKADGTLSTANQWADVIATYKTLTAPQGSCQGFSSLAVLVTGTNVVSYVPKGAWLGGSTGVGVVNVEGTLVTNTLIPTTSVVNSCASNSLSLKTVCTANDASVYLLSGTTLNSTLTSSGTGFIGFSGGSCTNCGVAMDAVHNRAVIGLSLAGVPGFQFLDLGTSTFATAFPSPSGNISEDVLIDPFRNFMLSPSEFNNYEIVDVTTNTPTNPPAFFENAIGGVSGFLDSAGEDCSTGIALAPAEFSDPSQVFIADLTQATFTPDSPGTWTAPSQLQTLSESSLSEGASGIAVAQGTNTGLVSGEFGGDAFTAIKLPATSGSGTGTPAILDWITCSIGHGFSNGLDPHTVNAYKSPNGLGHAIGLFASGGGTTLAVVDLTKMLDPTIVPRTTGPGLGHACVPGTDLVSAGVVTLIPVP